MWWEEAPESWRNRGWCSLHFYFFSCQKYATSWVAERINPACSLNDHSKHLWYFPRSFIGALKSRTIETKHTNISERQLKEEDKSFCSIHISFSPLYEVLCSTVAVCSCVCARLNRGHGEKVTVSIRNKLDHHLPPSTQLGNKFQELPKE